MAFFYTVPVSACANAGQDRFTILNRSNEIPGKVSLPRNTLSECFGFLISARFTEAGAFLLGLPQYAAALARNKNHSFTLSASHTDSTERN